MPEKRSERPFVEPTITPEASLTDVTLLSGGYSGKKGKGHGHESHGGHSNHSSGGHGGHGSGGRAH